MLVARYWVQGACDSAAADFDSLLKETVCVVRRLHGGDYLGDSGSNNSQDESVMPFAANGLQAGCVDTGIGGE